MYTTYPPPPPPPATAPPPRPAFDLDDLLGFGPSPQQHASPVQPPPPPAGAPPPGFFDRPAAAAPSYPPQGYAQQPQYQQYQQPQPQQQYQQPQQQQQQQQQQPYSVAPPAANPGQYPAPYPPAAPQQQYAMPPQPQQQPQQQQQQQQPGVPGYGGVPQHSQQQQVPPSFEASVPPSQPPQQQQQQQQQPYPAPYGAYTGLPPQQQAAPYAPMSIPGPTPVATLPQPPAPTPATPQSVDGTPGVAAPVSADEAARRQLEQIRRLRQELLREQEEDQQRQADRSAWPCGGCTFKNPVTEVKCQVCEAPRPGYASQVQSKPQPVQGAVVGAVGTVASAGAPPPVAAVAAGPAAPAAPAPAPAAAAAEWTCLVCTLSNPLREKECGACQQPRPAAITQQLALEERHASSIRKGAAAVPQQPQQVNHARFAENPVTQATWACLRCTFENPSTATACGMCEWRPPHVDGSGGSPNGSATGSGSTGGGTYGGSANTVAALVAPLGQFAQPFFQSGITFSPAELRVLESMQQTVQQINGISLDFEIFPLQLGAGPDQEQLERRWASSNAQQRRTMLDQIKHAIVNRFIDQLNSGRRQTGAQLVPRAGSDGRPQPVAPGPPSSQRSRGSSGAGLFPHQQYQQQQQQQQQPQQQQQQQTMRELDADEDDGIQWQKDADAATCNRCNTSFSFLTRRHHCRSCGFVFCALCSGFKCKLRAGGPDERVCLDCYKEKNTKFLGL